VKSGYLKTTQFSPKRALIVEVATVLRILKNLRNLQRSKKEFHSDREHILFDLITIFLLKFIILYCIIHGASFTTHMP
jgi:hypothetical protein